jgi:hypothetical protein
VTGAAYEVVGPRWRNLPPAADALSWQLVVVGSRSLASLGEAAIGRALDLAMEQFVPVAGSCPEGLITGTADGVDRAAVAWARAHRLPVHTLDTAWQPLSLLLDIVSPGTRVRVVALWDGQSRTTAGVVATACARGVPVLVRSTKR